MEILGPTHEKIVGVWVGSTDLEELHQVVELAMYVTTDSDWAFLRMRVSIKPM